MSRTVYNAIAILATDLTDKPGTYSHVNLAAGNCVFQTCWMNGAVTDGLPLLGIRTDSGSLGFIGEQNAIGPPPFDFNQKITSTNSNDSSGINYLILPYNNQHHGVSLTQVDPAVGLLTMRGNTGQDGTYGSATLSGGTVTVYTVFAFSTNSIFVCNATTDFIGPTPPGSFGNVWVDSVSIGNSFTVKSNNAAAQNQINWFIVNPQLTDGPGIAFANVILDRTVGPTQNYGTATLPGTGAALAIHRPGVVGTSIVYANTITPDTNPSNRGFILPAIDTNNHDILFWSSNGNDTQTFAWWLIETAAGVSS